MSLFQMIYFLALTVQPSAAQSLAEEGEWRLIDPSPEGLRQCRHSSLPSMTFREAGEGKKPYSGYFAPRMFFAFKPASSETDQLSGSFFWSSKEGSVTGPGFITRFKGKGTRGVEDYRVFVDGVDIQVPLEGTTFASGGEQTLILRAHESRADKFISSFISARNVSIHFLNDRKKVVHEATFDTRELGLYWSLLAKARLRCPAT